MTDTTTAHPPAPGPAPGLVLDHRLMAEAGSVRRYFVKLRQVMGLLAKVVAEDQAAGRFTFEEGTALAEVLAMLAASATALGHKHHFAGRTPEAAGVAIDALDSGFPVAQEMMLLATDAMGAASQLAQTPSAEALKDRMVRTILEERRAPVRLQFALSQRLYAEELAKGGLFWARNEPEALYLGDTGTGRSARRRYLVRWSVYDAGTNLPVIYLMDLEDSGGSGLPTDGVRWPSFRRQLMAQAVSGLTLLTIARGLDADFTDLHPKRLRRFTVGPLHSSAFTAQGGPVADVLAAAKAPEGEDWAILWTEEDLVAERVETVKSGWFGEVERQVYRLAEPAERGWSERVQTLMLPERPYQALAESDPPGLRALRKLVVDRSGRVLSLR